MAVKRISDIDIKNNNSLFTAIYGNITDSEFFIDSDLKKYNLWQQLHLYLKSEGYIVLFYDSNNVHSYSQADLIEFLDLKYTKESIQPNRYVGKLNSPFKQTRFNNANKIAEKNISENPLHQSIQLVSDTGHDRDKFYKTSKDTGELDCLKKLFAHNPDKPNKKVAYIIKNPETHAFPRGDKDAYTDFFNSLKKNYVKNNSSDKIFVIYNYKDTQSLISSFDDPTKQQFFFFSNDFKQQFVEKNNTFLISLPDQSECRNLLNSVRLDYTKNVIWGTDDLDNIAEMLTAEERTLSENKKKLDSISQLSMEELIKKDVIKKKTIDFNFDTVLSDLKEKIKGQNENIEIIAEDIEIWAMEEQKEQPLSFFLAGKSGTGKSHTAEMFAKALEPSGFGYRVIDMTEYIDETSVAKIVGAPPTYVGYGDTPILIEDIKANRRMVFLFDEIEEAHPKILTVLMNLIDAGRLTYGDYTGNFKECILFFSSNLAENEIVAEKKKFFEENNNENNTDIDKLKDLRFKERVRKILQNTLNSKKNGLYLKDAVWNRIRYFLVYDQLKEDDVKNIVEYMIRKAAGKKKIKINQIDSEYLTTLTSLQQELSSGIRDLKQKINNDIPTAIKKQKCNSNCTYDLKFTNEIIFVENNAKQNN